ncbi:MAG: hypothetical protein K2H53_07420 [Clostridia bacterium]|nr:hypothetical protein [Clostridia bacterium]
MAENTDQKRIEVAIHMSEAVGYKITPDKVLPISKSSSGDGVEVFVAQTGYTSRENLLVACWFHEVFGYRIAMIPNLWRGNSCEKLELAGVSIETFSF